MFKALKPFITAFIICCACTGVSAQHTFEGDTQPALKSYEASLTKLAQCIYVVQQDSDRYARNANFIKALVNTLRLRDSFHYDFDSLKQISIVRSPDRVFRLFSWQIPLNDGTFRFYGTIQMATKDGSLKLFPLIDNTAHFKDVNEITDNKNWYGSRYYEIVPIVNSGRATYYVLLGWKGNDKKTSKKVIEVLSFNKGTPIFGKNVFEGAKGSPVKNRIVFEYNKLNSMTLQLDKKVGMIVYDHLAPFDPEMAGNFEYYGSDSSFDAYKVVGDKLKLVENVELKNNPNAMDGFYTDPAIKNTTAPRKF